MNRMLRLAGITAVVLALTGAIGITTRLDAPTPVGAHPTQVAPDPARAGVEVSSGELEPVAWSRSDPRRSQSVGARFDALQDPETEGGSTRAGSGYFEFFPSEFSKLVLAYERLEME